MLGIANFSKHFVTSCTRCRADLCEQKRRARKMTKNTANFVIHPAQSIDSSDSIARRKIRRSSRLVATAVQKRNRPSRVRRREEGTERYCATLSRPENKSSSLSKDNKVNRYLRASLRTGGDNDRSFLDAYLEVRKCVLKYDWLPTSCVLGSHPGRYLRRRWYRNKNGSSADWNSRKPVTCSPWMTTICADDGSPGDPWTIQGRARMEPARMCIREALVSRFLRFFHTRSRAAFYEKRRYITRWNDERRTVDSRPEVARRSNRCRGDDPGSGCLYTKDGRVARPRIVRTYFSAGRFSTRNA